MQSQSASFEISDKTLPYLHRVIFYATALTNSNFINKEETDGEALIDALARLLLEASDPSNLILDVPNVFLPKADVTMDEEGDSDTETTEEEENMFPPFNNISRFKGGRPRDYTRTDALRSLLRVLAPIAMDVAARSSMHVLADECDRVRLPALVLFGIWINEAPQLAPLISDLFGIGVNGEKKNCPLVSLAFVTKRMSGNTDYNEMDAREAVVVADAVRELLDHYSAKRYEREVVREWWDWDSSLFVLLHAHGRGVGSSHGDAMDVNDDTITNNKKEIKDGFDNEVAMNSLKDLEFYIGGYSPEANVPHCKNWKEPTFQLKWHITRAIGSLFALRSLPLSVFLKLMGVFEQDVPFVRHPWTIMEEETYCEVHRLRGVGRVVLPNIKMSKIKFGHCANYALNFETREKEECKKRAHEDAEKDINKEYLFQVPSSEDIREVVPMHPVLVHIGKGILLPRRGSVASYAQWRRSTLGQNEFQSTQSSLAASGSYFISTDTSRRNISFLGVAMSNDPNPPPILICGPPGSGKSSLVRELSRQCSSFCSSSKNLSSEKSYQVDELLELHIDEETDSKTLLGSYVATDIPGEFVWMAGPLTSAARQGRWVLIEDVDRCPEEIQSSLIRLLEERILPLGVGSEEKCHPNFRLFGTCGTNANSFAESNAHNTRRKSVLSAGSNGKRVLHPNLWRKVHVNPLPFSELKCIGSRLHPNLPHSVANAVLDVLRKLDRSGRNDADLEHEDPVSDTEQHRPISYKNLKDILGRGARHVSVRDYIKLLSRISAALDFEPGTEYATESQRLICLAETVDVFAMSCPCIENRRDFICEIAAPIWGLTADAALRYIEGRIPSVSFDNNRRVKIGRAYLTAVKDEDDGIDGDTTPGKRRNFAETNHALRFMESIAVCASSNEPALLVGETGCGKTTLVQRLASLTGRELIVLNLSLQTDSTDLLGGFKPLEMRHIARGVYGSFVDLFVSSFSRSQNAQFLRFVLNAFESGDWKKLAQCFIKAAGMGEKKVRQGTDLKNMASWAEFRQTAERFERQRVASESGMAFLFSEGALIDALRTGKWVLLDEINLASSETLQRLCGLLDNSTGSITLTEKGDAEAVKRHPGFRLFAAMNPATDAGKKDLPGSIRSRFTELYVDELIDSNQLRFVASRYLNGAVVTNGMPLEHSESILTAVDAYLECRLLSEQSLVDGGGQRPRYTMRTLCRALAAARSLILQQRYSPQRAILEGFELAFEGSLDLPSRCIVQKLFNSSLGKGLSSKERDHPGRRPDGKNGIEAYALIKPFWMKTGDEEQTDWAEPSSSNGRPRFILTPSATANLRRLCQAVASGPWSILLEGPTSAGKTSLIEYLAKRVGHRCVRINNHEHTDIQEYTGSYAADSNGKISFQEGILVQALRKGYWVILDELNLAPSEVLEALNRLLDDNRELYLAEINDVVKPHPNFRLFATQNPAGAYGGRKPLSRAFRNRFVEIHMADIPENEMTIILERRCGCPPSHAKLLVKVMKSLRQRRSRTGIFRGKDGLVTPRDLLRWAERGAESKLDLAREGFMLLAERLRIDEEKNVVQGVLEKELNVIIDMEELYYGENSESRVILNQALTQTPLLNESGLHIDSIAPTKSILRLLSLVMRCIKKKEPVLLVGDTGCGKTTVVQLLSVMLKTQLTVVNCHASTETSDLLGGFRPIRGRENILQEMVEKVAELIQNWEDSSFNISSIVQSSLDSPKAIMDFLSELSRLYLSDSKNDKSNREKTDKKRRKLANGAADALTSNPSQDHLHCEIVENTFHEISVLYQKYMSLFEWVDGPLVCSMKQGGMLLLDEMSLAEDAVLERLNSVLEPSRTLTLAEKGCEGPVCVNETGVTQSLSSEIKANEHFRMLATMNPGGDFGKRELSPALRSRFTEIWVPPVTHRPDVDLVLERSFMSYTDIIPMDNSDHLRTLMLDYVDWFNDTLCADPTTFCNDFKLSLRDVLSWARFITEVSVKHRIIDQYSAYLHGVALMHLDGVGLGTGVSNYDAYATRDKAKAYLLHQITPWCQSQDINWFKDELKELQDSIIDTEDYFGIRPFTILKGKCSTLKDSQFHMAAPTTGMNLRRVLRGMQISKPILLEGSPGVGKTSLISALALASGHNLVRINLSEQTDISDLMGNDLPFSSDSDADTSSQATFRWCDGVLLQAIKRGDWVLLDELNLASQSVLEGLNSCLDHRASVYIPELGKSFDCPPSFRIFAAQNPLAQGGGRKGLPKSFLNRFTKVYVEALTRDDLLNIVSDQYPSVPMPLVTSMVDINCGVQDDIVHRGLYGQQGSPWEFNLRDVFRWCQLLTAQGTVPTASLAAKYADILYTQRLRTTQDRLIVKKRFDEHLGINNIFKTPHKLTVSETHVLVGSTLLKRNEDVSAWSDISTQDSEPTISQSLYDSMEAVASCIKMNWPCLLVGSSQSGKSTILKILGDLCNIHVETLGMSSSTDVTELIGCFEQTDSMKVSKEVLKIIRRIYHRVCLSADTTTLDLLDTVAKNYSVIRAQEASVRSKPFLGDAKLLSAVLELIICYEKIAMNSSSFQNEFSNQIRFCRQWLSSMESKESAKGVQSPFQWVDGTLVKAMERGYWLLLENVNFCPSSVLDRLNPLMEFGGCLVVTECGITGTGRDAQPRVIKPHPNFRLFLSMDPHSHGEVSRAMRNRCVEVCLVPPSFDHDTSSEMTGDQVKTVDALSGLWQCGVRSHEVGQFMVTTHKTDCKQSLDCHEDVPTMKTLKDWGTMFISLLKRGGSSSLATSHLLLYEIQEDSNALNVLTPAFSGLVANMSSRKDLALYPSTGEFARLGRLIRVMTNHDQQVLRQILTMVPCNLNLFQSSNKNWLDLDEVNLSFLSICRLAEVTYMKDIGQLLSFYDGYCPELSSQVKVVVFLLRLMLSNVQKDHIECRPTSLLNIVSDAQVKRGHISIKQSPACTHLAIRLHHALEEAFTYYQLDKSNIIPAVGDMNVIAKSYYISKKRIDASVVTCPVTSHLFPLFQTIDMLNQRVSKYETKSATMQVLFFRDMLWQYLKRSKDIGIGSSSHLGVSFDGFLINYTWLKKAVRNYNDSLHNIGAASDSDTSQIFRQLKLSFEKIERMIEEFMGGSISSSDTLWKKGGHPVLPSSVCDLKSFWDLQAIAKKYALTSEHRFGFTRTASATIYQVDINELVTESHPCLFLDRKFLSQLLGAMSTIYWATTDEIKGQVDLKQNTCDIITSSIVRAFDHQVSSFISDLNHATIDTTIQTVENALDLEALKSMGGESRRNGTDFVHNLANRFGEIQTAQIGEICCIQDEESIIFSVCSTLQRHLYSKNTSIIVELRKLRPALKSFIEMFMSHTLWSVEDLRPYQTFVWTLDSDKICDDNVVLRTVSCLLPRMISSFHNHHWCNLYNNLECINPHLHGPSLWNKDDIDFGQTVNTSPLFNIASKQSLLASCTGPARIKMNAHRGAMFHLLQLPGNISEQSFFTMENGDARRSQASRLLSLITRSKSWGNGSPIDLIKYNFSAALTAISLQHGCDTASIVDLLDETPTSQIDTHLVPAIGNELNDVAAYLIEKIQLINITDEDSVLHSQYLAQAWIYIGLLRLHLLVPSSPIDPGRKPAAKVEQLNFLTRDIDSNILSISLHNGLSDGDFGVNTPASQFLCNQKSIYYKKKARQEKKIIQRPPNSPPFYDLYREIHHFCKTFSVKKVTNMISLIETATDSSFRSQENNLQCSAAAFCNRLSTVYFMYEDVTIPCTNEIQTIQRGLRELSLLRAHTAHSKLILDTQNLLLKYPCIDNHNPSLLIEDSLVKSFEELQLQFDLTERNGARSEIDKIVRSFHIASLFRLHLYASLNKTYSGLSNTDFQSAISSLSLIASSSMIDTDQKSHRDNKTKEETEAEREERELREYFPDHGAEFQRILTRFEESEDDHEDGYSNDTEGDITEISQLSVYELSQAVSLHSTLFSGVTRVDNRLRTRAFITSFEAASHMSELTNWMKNTADEKLFLGSHLFALALRCNPNRNAWFSPLNSELIRDFHNDPFPSESIKADMPLRELLIRIAQLLRAFPGHSVLLGLGKVVERIRQLDIQVESLGKVMSGLEVILRRAQDWEQHASQHVLLGKPLNDISALVASWRKLELHSWSSLLTMREKRRGIKANRHWPRLYSLIHKERVDITEQSHAIRSPENTLALSPKWIWKGYPRISKRLGINSALQSIEELSKVLDTFILASNLAECSERIGLIKSFANELRHESCFTGLNRLPLARLLHSLWNYYYRLIPVLMHKKNKQREPIEKRLKDEVKLAKWDEQTYYSLTESSEKNHRKLMKLLRDYDEVLDSSVMSILEQNFVEGIRSTNQAQAGDHEPITAIPGNASMFPDLTPAEIDVSLITPRAKANSTMFLIEVLNDDWASTGLLSCTDKYITGIGHYYRRMESVISQNVSWANAGASCVADLIEALFSRIETLRNEKSTTKQVKQRALVDLFKCLKEQGFSSMKWSIPSQIRESHQLLQLPIPNIGNVKSKATREALEKGESYFHRCQVEISRMRSEISMLGSQYMSQREMTLMQGYSDHILFLLCQERCMLAEMIETISEFGSFFDGYRCINDDIPLGQKQISHLVVSFEKSLALTIEGVWQLVLLLKETSYLVDNGEERDKIRDTITVLTGCAQTLEEAYSPSRGRVPISFDRLHNINVDVSRILDNSKRDLVSCVDACINILPSSIFDECINSMCESLNLALSITQPIDAFDTTCKVDTKATYTLKLISSLVQRTLISAQSVCMSREDETKSSSMDHPQSIDKDITVCDSHTKMINEWDGLQLSTLQNLLQDVSKSILSLHDNGVSNKLVLSLCTKTAINAFTLVQKVVHLYQLRLEDSSLFYCQHTKFLYVLLRVFRVLIAKGFCSDDVSDGGDGDGAGGMGEMKFEDDVEGTGMGEGEGKNDVTDQIENEEQLLGLKGEEQQEVGSSQEKKELNQDEVDTGMEMEGDFQGETYDIPEQQEDDNKDNDGDNEEEVDREMGDGYDPNEQVVDEKMWDKDEDDLDQMNQEDEKFEDNSKMAGEKLDDEMRTKEDQDNEQGSDEGDKAKQDTEKHNSNQDAPDESTDNNKDETENINDDTEDKYEDSHGYEVRDEQNTADNNDEQDLDIDLNEGMDIDEDYDANDQGDGNTSLSEEMDDAHDPDAMDENDNDDDGEDDPEEVEEAEGIDVAGQGGNIENSENSKDEKPDDGEEGSDEPNMEHAAKNQIESKEQLHGIAAPDGEDAVKENYVEDQVDEAKDDGNAIDDAGGADENMGESSQGSGGNGNDGSWQSRQAKEQEKGRANTELDEIPNPLRSPGDAEKFWHKKLDIINDSPEHEDSTPRDTIGEEPQQEKARQDGVFEYSKENEDSNGQVLGAAEEEQAKQLQENDNDEFQSKEEKDSADTEMDYRNEQSKRDKCKQSQSESTQNPTTEEQSKSQQENVSDQVEEKQNNDELQEGDQSMNHDNERPILDDVPITSNRIPSEVSDLEDLDESNDDIQEVEVSMEMSALDVQEARLYWQTIQAETNNLSRRLCEKLRLVMEPLVATKLRGDYRTGKRVNMKRIIGYIASGYRKDKIWLRRTKPAKRDYRVLIAVDDSESMQKSQAGDMGLRALSTLANGMSQLEIGQLGVASFGEEMKLIHQFNLPFTSESGVNVVSNFTFSQKRTRTALCVESAISALKSVESTSSSMQLVFMISDGRIERDSRSKLRRLIRQMSEENMLLVMIIVEGEDSNNPSNKVKESILNMKEVSFVKGKPQIKHFIEDYPFPYYLVVNDLTALPEILGDALKQWFEMMTQIQNGI